MICLWWEVLFEWSKESEFNNSPCQILWKAAFTGHEILMSDTNLSGNYVEFVNHPVKSLLQIVLKAFFILSSYISRRVVNNCNFSQIMTGMIQSCNYQIKVMGTSKTSTKHTKKIKIFSVTSQEYLAPNISGNTKSKTR